MFWETKGKEFQLLTEHWSSPREAQSMTFPSYFLSELHLGKLQTLLPRRVPQNQDRPGRTCLAFWELFLCSAWMQRAPAERPHAGRATAHRQGTTRTLSSPQQVHSQLNPPSGSALGYSTVTTPARPNLTHAVSAYSKQLTNQ